MHVQEAEVLQRWFLLAHEWGSPDTGIDASTDGDIAWSTDNAVITHIDGAPVPPGTPASGSCRPNVDAVAAATMPRGAIHRISARSRHPQS